MWRTVRVGDRVHQSADTVSFVLTSLDGAPLPGFRAGQYLSVGVKLADGARQIRQYSLSSAPSQGDWRITVKRVLAQPAADGTVVPAGEVSNYLFENVFEGDELQVTTPFGDLILAENDAPIVKLINALLTQAVREDASDIHLEIFEQRALVRFRVDGALRDVVEPRRGLHPAMVSPTARSWPRSSNASPAPRCTAGTRISVPASRWRPSGSVARN